MASKKNQTDLLLFHHRYPTSTENVKRAAHPFNTGQYFGKTKYVLVHNGVISNPKDTRAKHEALKKPIEYQSVLENGKFNDSEALLWDLALTLEGKQKELTVYGGIAFICIKMVDNKPVKLYFGKNTGRPLKMLRDDKTMMISSEGEGEEIKPATLYTYDYKKRRLTDRFFRIPSYNPANAAAWGYDKKYGTGSERTGYTPSGAASHSHHARNVINDNVCAPGSGVLGNPVTTEVKWWTICSKSDIIFDSSGVAHYPYEVTFYEDGSYDLWNDYKEDWESGMWLDEDFKYSIEEQQTTGHKAMDFISTPKATPRKKEVKGSSISVEGSLASIIVKPSQQDVDLLLFNEIGKAEGYFDAAFFSMEEQWVDLEMKYDGLLPPIEDRKRIALLLEGIKQIENEADYEDEHSVHKLWRADKVTDGVAYNPHVDVLEDKQTNFLQLTAKAGAN